MMPQRWGGPAQPPPYHDHRTWEEVRQTERLESDRHLTVGQQATLERLRKKAVLPHPTPYQLEHRPAKEPA